MATVWGVDAKTYFDALGVANDTWTELSGIKDLSVPLEKEKVDSTRRADAGWKTSVCKMKALGLDLVIPADPTDAAYLALEAAHINSRAIGIAIMDGAIATPGTQGLKADFQVFKFQRGEPADGLQMMNVSLKPTDSATAPTWVTIS